MTSEGLVQAFATFLTLTLVWIIATVFMMYVFEVTMTEATTEIFNGASALLRAWIICGVLLGIADIITFIGIINSIAR